MRNDKIILGIIFGLLVLGIGSFSINDANAALDSKGNEFLISFIRNYGGNGNLQLHISSDLPTQATVNYPANNPTFITTVNVNPGQITIVIIPSPAQVWSAGTPSNNAVKVTSPQEITVYTANIQSATSDAALALPTDAFSFKYIVTAYTPLFNTEFVAIAPSDNTKVTITPSVSLISGQQANVPFTVTLNKGQGFSASSAGTQDLSGSIITADKPIGLTNGNQCTNVPPGVFACDHIYEHGIPVQGWGTRVLVADLPDRSNGSIYRIFASSDNTQISLDGSTIANLNEGGFHETSYLSGNHIISGNHPIFVVQYMPSKSSPGSTTGDPAMANIIPAEQFLTSYTFSTVGGGQFPIHFVNVIAANSDINTIEFDGSVIGGGAFSPIGLSGFSSATISPISQGTHTTSSSHGHGILVGGLGNFDSYLYPGGAAFEFINPQPEDDRDGDGVFDVDDACPDEFAETADGCPLQCVEPEQISILYDFNGEGIPEEWSGVTTTESVQGFTEDGFDGRFVRNITNPPQNTTLTLTDLPPHDTIDIGFLLGIIDSWDSTNGSVSPDLFNVSVDGDTIFTETFALASGTISYEAPEGVEIQFGEHRGFWSSYPEAAYDMGKDPTFQNIPHTSDTLTIDFFASGTGWQGGSDESWGIENVQVSTVLSTPICEIPEVEEKKNNGGSNEWDTRPTFGISHETRHDQVVENGFSFNSEYFTLTDNHWTPFAEQSVEIGTVNSFSATVYADKKLKIQEFLFGIPTVGEAQLAELGVEVWYDFNGEIEDVKVVQKSDVIDADTVSVSHEKVKCLATDAEAKCDTTTVSMTFLEPLADKVMAIKAIDWKNRDQRTFLNEGFDISGDSLNPMLAKLIPSNLRDQGLLKVTQVAKYSPYWSTEDGRTFEMNSFGSFKQINQKFERFQDTGNAFTRQHSGFGGILAYEQDRATDLFDSSKLISELPESFAYIFPESGERITDEMLQKMLVQQEIAKEILDEMDRQDRHY